MSSIDSSPVLGTVWKVVTFLLTIAALGGVVLGLYFVIRDTQVENESLDGLGVRLGGLLAALSLISFAAGFTALTSVKHSWKAAAWSLALVAPLALVAWGWPLIWIPALVYAALTIATIRL